MRDPRVDQILSNIPGNQKEPGKTSICLHLIVFSLFYIYFQILPAFSHCLYIVSIIFEQALINYKALQNWKVILIILLLSHCKILYCFRSHYWSLLREFSYSFSIKKQPWKILGRQKLGSMKTCLKPLSFWQQIHLRQETGPLDIVEHQRKEIGKGLTTGSSILY